MKLLTTIIAATVFAMTSLSSASAEQVSKQQITEILTQQGYSVSDFDRNMVAVKVGEYDVLVGIHGSDSDVSYLTFLKGCLLYTSPSPRDQRGSRMPSSA